ncbi:unnamed protein product [Hydatigera taeniaeformis]|uniref:Aldo_ket_red domain-containing protein n=1 Tax=Hydatigena taeniaeformis TaxID=6205 RepID=A0A0R3WKH5_HYDTA|nr:unnamed protein product [Hydatigera taeniaeformis]
MQVTIQALCLLSSNSCLHKGVLSGFVAFSTAWRMSVNDYAILNSGYKIPRLGFGTFEAAPDIVAGAVDVALSTGYRHIDCAMSYGNEKEVGEAIKTSLKKYNLKREEIFITSKAMEGLVSAGLVKSIGVSNFNKRQIERVLSICTIPPAVNQVEVNIHFPNTKLMEFCHSKNIQIEGYAPLGSPAYLHRLTGKTKSLMEDENVVEIAHKHNRTPAQVLLRHGLQRGVIVLVGCVNSEFIKSDFNVFDFELTDMEMAKLNKTASEGRLIQWPGQLEMCYLFVRTSFDVDKTTAERLGFLSPKEVVTRSVEVAMDAGFRHIDCAMFYGNEAEVGAAIAASMKKHSLKRGDIFVTSKLWCDKHAPADVRKTCERSIKDLGVEYLDLYLIHWPVSFQHKEGYNFDIHDPNCIVYEYHKIEDTWKAMEELVSVGLVKSIGVSNFSIGQLDRILGVCSIPPAVNQVEVNINWLNTKLIEFCHSKNIHVEDYAPFGSPGFMKSKEKSILEYEDVVEIARKHNKTPGQVLLRHGLQRGLIVLTKSVHPERIKSNFDVRLKWIIFFVKLFGRSIPITCIFNDFCLLFTKVFDFVLTDAEMDKLNKAGLNKRLFAIPA